MQIGLFSRNLPSTLSYTEAATALIIGTLPLLFLSKLPDSNYYLVIGSILLITIVFIWKNKFSRFLFLIGMSFLWACWHGLEITQKIDFLSSD